MNAMGYTKPLFDELESIVVVTGADAAVVANWRLTSSWRRSRTILTAGVLRGRLDEVVL